LLLCGTVKADLRVVSGPAPKVHCREGHTDDQDGNGQSVLFF
jgi:hypothetical protein